MFNGSNIPDKRIMGEKLEKGVRIKSDRFEEAQSQSKEEAEANGNGGEGVKPCQPQGRGQVEGGCRRGRA